MKLPLIIANAAAMRQRDEDSKGKQPAVMTSRWTRQRLSHEARNEQIWAEIARRHEDGVRRSYIVNVSAMEGRFHFYKQGTHPHTNMAKAALNMLTRTSALKLAQQHSISSETVTDTPVIRGARAARPRRASHVDLPGQ